MGEEQKTLQLGDLVGGKYQLLKKIGEGGHGRVYRAVNVLIGREVAIKVLRPEIVRDETSRRRFFREAKTANLVRHPNVVDVLDVGDSDDGPWMVQELLRGESLHAVLVREGPLAASRAVELLLPAISALAVAHAKGIAHRDFKPDNVFLARDEQGGVTPKILDFGLSKPTVRFGVGRESDQITASGVIVGTPAYLSPERVRLESDGDIAGDVWAIGVVLYECVTGNLPFHTRNMHEMFARISRGQLVPIEDQSVELDETFTAIVDRCLRLAPRERYASAAELEEDLRAFVQHARGEDAPAAPMRAPRAAPAPVADELATGDDWPAHAPHDTVSDVALIHSQEVAPHELAPVKGPSSTVLHPTEIDRAEPPADRTRAPRAWMTAAAALVVLGGGLLWSTAGQRAQPARSAAARPPAVALAQDASPTVVALVDAGARPAALPGLVIADAAAPLHERVARSEPRAPRVTVDAAVAAPLHERVLLREHR